MTLNRMFLCCRPFFEVLLFLYRKKPRLSQMAWPFGEFAFRNGSWATSSTKRAGWRTNRVLINTSIISKTIRAMCGRWCAPRRPRALWPRWRCQRRKRRKYSSSGCPKAGRAVRSTTSRPAGTGWPRRTLPAGVLGPARTQEVQAGDSVKLSVYGKYEGQQKGKANIGSFIATGAKDRLVADLLEFSRVTARSAEPNAITVFNIIDLLVKNLQQKDAPEAYMMYALYGSDTVLYKTGKQVLTKNAANKHEILEGELYISKDGYMEAFVVNETEEDVWPVCRKAGSMISPYKAPPPLSCRRPTMTLGGWS